MAKLKMPEKPLITPTAKICPSCNQEKPISEFYENKRLKDGHFVMCKTCYKDQIWQRTKEQTKQEAKEYAAANPVDEQTVTSFRKNTRTLPHPVRLPIINAHELKRIRSKFYKSAFFRAYTNLLALGLEESVIERLFGTQKGCFELSRQKGDIEQDLAYQEGIEKVHRLLAQHLLHRATGYDFEEVKIIYTKDQKKVRACWKPIRKEIVSKHMPADMQALIFYLTNRFPEDWKVSRELLMGKTPTYDGKPGQRVRKTIESIGRNVLEGNTVGSKTEHTVQNGSTQLPDGSKQTSQK